MVKAQYSPQQLAERFIDQREIQNVMGKYALLTMICKQADLVDRFWSKQADQPTLAKNDGWYVGLDAIRGYYQAIRSARPPSCSRRCSQSSLVTRPTRRPSAPANTSPAR